MFFSRLFKLTYIGRVFVAKTLATMSITMTATACTLAPLVNITQIGLVLFVSHNPGESLSMSCVYVTNLLMGMSLNKLECFSLGY